MKIQIVGSQRLIVQKEREKVHQKAQEKYFSNFKTIEELERKLLNDENHSEFKKNINSKDEIIYNYNNKLINYNHNADKKSENRFTKTKLENLDNKMLPKYVIENQKKYSDWF